MILPLTVLFTQLESNCPMDVSQETLNCAPDKVRTVAADWRI